MPGEDPFPHGYSLLPPDRIGHVHAKDCSLDGHKPEWGPLGTRSVDWKGQIAALIRDGYRGPDQSGNALARTGRQ